MDGLEGMEIDIDRYESQLRRLVSQPSISEGARGVKECAQILVDLHAEAGFQEAEVFDTGELANVWAYYDAGAKHTLAVYAMFDHAPVPDGWGRDPFGAEIGPAGKHPRVMFGHGIRTKGPYLAWLSAIQSMIQSGCKLPFNIACLLEGEEFVGSTHYRDMIRHYRDRLQGCIGAISPSAGQSPNGSVSIGLGSKGCAYFELVSSGKHSGKGPITSSVHSSAQPVVHSPAWRLVQALSTLTEQGSWGTEVLFDGFYEGVHTPDSAEEELLTAIAQRFSGENWINQLPGIAGRGEVSAIKKTAESPTEALRMLLYDPTFNIDGLRAGYVNPDSPLFTLPGEARVRIDMRYGPGQDGDTLLDRMYNHLKTRGFSDIQLVNMGVHNAAQANLEDPIVTSNVEVLEELDCPTTIWPMKPAGPPLGDFCTEMGVPALGGVGLGMVTSSGSHSDESFAVAVDEFMILESGIPEVSGFKGAIDFYVRYIERLGQNLA